ncbi:Afadin and alpha-actinin-binding-domain-containing protein [Stachybotrys elegans]|uniref:Afadin and alpha-actinin-binding-domain-containing protein n=1 Tax=Stachybotrys elegans TaxID=80388 RepID=A0A8K0WW81_9HYPO|nr:Afadin and alpha-actinin-binding-domain-containing protein [Stachybotrys elegans]
MFGTENLRTASLYINNQLLSRGLLRDGQAIDFADPGDHPEDVAATMGAIIGIVNDLILRRDRDAEQRESLSTAMRALRAENLKNTNDIVRLKERHAEAQRKLDIAESSEASLRTQLKSAEAAVRGLKDEVARTKALVAQTRASCAAEVRRRDRQIDTLKKQLGEAGRARGSRNNSAITTISVTGDLGEEKSSPARAAAASSDAYSLRDETNVFLAKLAQNLSEENESLLRVMGRTMQQLREMSGWSNSEDADDHVVKHTTWQDMESDLGSVLDHLRTILTNPSFVPIEDVMVREEEINRLKDGWVKMETRWKEAVHLIDGWRRRMASNGRPVCEEELKMGLRLSPVRVKDVEETRQAYNMDLSVVAEEAEEEQIPEVLATPCPPSHHDMHLVPTDVYDDDVPEQSDGESSGYDDDLGVDDFDMEEPNVEILQQSTAIPYHPDRSLASSPLPEPPQLSPLKSSPSAGNRGAPRGNQGKQRPGDFPIILEENTRDKTSYETAPKPPPHRSPLPPLRLRPVGPVVRAVERPRSPSRNSLDDVLLSKPRAETPEEEAEETPVEPPRQVEEPREKSLKKSDKSDRSENLQTPRRGLSRLPLPKNAEALPQQSPLTMAAIAAKLAASERDADAARVRAKLRAARGPRGVKKPTISPVERDISPATAVSTDEVASRDGDPVKQDVAAAAAAAITQLPQDEAMPLVVEKRKKGRRTSRVASRRRSTLSPWELESLILGKV